MSKNTENRDANGKIIVDRTYVENTLRRRVVLSCVLSGVFLLSYVAIVCFIVIRYGEANPKSVLYFLFLAASFAYIALPLKNDVAALNAVKNGDFRVTEDTVAGKYVRSGGRHTSYYVKGTASGNVRLPPVSAKEHRNAALGETFWLVSVQTKNKPVNCAVYLSSVYTLSGELMIRLQGQPGAAGSGAFGYPSAGSAGDPVSAPYTAVNDHQVTSHYGESHGKVTCASCGKKFDCSKHGDTCPKCGAVRIK